MYVVGLYARFISIVRLVFGMHVWFVWFVFACMCLYKCESKNPKNCIRNLSILVLSVCYLSVIKKKFSYTTCYTLYEVPLLYLREREKGGGDRETHLHKKK